MASCFRSVELLSAMGNNRKKIDNRIRVLIENGVAQGRRSMFVVVGDKARDQVHYPTLPHLAELLTGVLSGGCTPSHVVKGHSEGQAKCSVVLQKGIGILQPQEEENETTKQEDKSRKNGD